MYRTAKEFRGKHALVLSCMLWSIFYSFKFLIVGFLIGNVMTNNLTLKCYLVLNIGYPET